jgi:F-type H+-transporting ATPase subunit delta
VTARALARRYAQALFDVTRRTGTQKQAADDLMAFSGLVSGHAELKQVLEAPGVPVHKKKAVVDAILSGGGGVSAEVGRLLVMLAERDRLMLLPDLAERYAELANAANRVMPADVVTAAPLDDDARAALADALGHATGGQVQMTERVDPSIIGGVVARVGSVVFDSSVAHQLEQLRQKLRSQM